MCKTCTEIGGVSWILFRGEDVEVMLVWEEVRGTWVMYREERVNVSRHGNTFQAATSIINYQAN